MGLALALALVAFAAAHASIVFGLARRRPRWRAALALVLAPLAPWWGWRDGMRRRTLAWAVTLALYAVGVAIES